MALSYLPPLATNSSANQQAFVQVLSNPYNVPPPAAASEGWTIYDVLIRCVESARWASNEEKQAAVNVVEGLRAANALGTIASQVHLSTEEATK